MIADPSVARVTEDLADSDFVSGVKALRWRLVAKELPRLDFAISATEPTGGAFEYGFRADLANFPSQAPLVRIWDHQQDTPLPIEKRPKGSRLLEITFQKWGDDTVYRPWERRTGPHLNSTVTHPQLTWRPERRLVFVFEDLHAILNSNARALHTRTAA